MRILNRTNIPIFVNSNEVNPGEIYHQPDTSLTSITVDSDCGSVRICAGYSDLHTYASGNLGETHRFDLELGEIVVSIFCIDNSVGSMPNDFAEQHKKLLKDASPTVESAYIAAYRRIDELTDAIKKSIQRCVPTGDTSDVKQIRNWAKEIMFQCNIIDSIDE